MPNPLINQGTLNRALTSLQVIGNSSLNITAGFFGTRVATINFDGTASSYLATLTGAVPSGHLFQMVTVSAYLLKSQSLAAQWEQQRLTNTAIGDVIVVTDSPILSTYYLYNCVLMNVSGLDLSGESVDYPLTIQGTYPVNSSLFN